MGLWIIPYRMPPAEAVIARPREQVFHGMTSFARGEAPNAKVLTRTEGSLLVEFHSEIEGLLGRKKTHRTVERVALSEPEEVRFSGVEGPLDLLEDRFVFEDVGGATHVRYESVVGLKGSVLGWLLCALYVRPVLGRFMKKHVEQAKARAESSE